MPPKPRHKTRLATLAGAALAACGEMAGAPAATDLIRLTAAVAGEMGVDAIPITSGVDVAALTAGDESPLEVVVEVPAGKSRRGWDYRASALQDIVRVVGEQGLPGYLGHQRADAVDHEFPPVVTHWIGAKFENGRAYFRGVVDGSAADLKRWIRAKSIRTVSIFGKPTLARVGGETHVTGYAPLSIDWTPLGRAGMPTAIVAMSGEMDAINGTPGASGIPAGGATTPQDGGAPPQQRGSDMTLEELLAELRKQKAAPGQVLGEMGWQPRDVLSALQLDLPGAAALLNGEQWASLQTEHAAMGELAQVFGLAATAPAADVLAAARSAREAQASAAQAARTALVDRVIGEMVAAGVDTDSAKAARQLVHTLAQPKLAENADENAIRAAVGEIAGLEHVKTLIGLATATTAGASGVAAIRPLDTTRAGDTAGAAGSTTTQAPAGLRRRMVAV